jgi:2-dehydropantoate 2-reductase
VRINGSELEVLWQKLARQAPVAAATSLAQRPIGELRNDPEWRLRLRGAVDETCAVAARDGVPLTAAAQWEIIDAMPPDLTSSTARDVAAGRPSELDAITGAAVRAGRRLGVPMPTLERLLAEAEDACRAQSH